MTAEVIGMETIEEIFDQIAPRESRNLMRATVYGIAGEIRKEAKKRAPVDTGNLKQAIKTKRRRSKPDQPVSDVVVDSGKNSNNDAFYWRFVENGTLNTPERPFIRPAKELIFSDIKNIMAEQFGKKLESALARKRKKLEAAK